MAQRQMVLQDGDFFELPWGRVVFHNNELHIETFVGDAAGVSFIGATNCKLSWKDSAGQEKVLLEMRQNAKGDGEFYIGGFSQAVYNEMIARGGAWADKALDQAMVELATINPDGCELRVPLRCSAGLVGAGSAGITDTIWAPDGRSFTQQQSDGNFVTYFTTVPFSKAGEHVTVVWASGAIKPEGV